MPSTTIQSRISAFEALTGPSSSSSQPSVPATSVTPQRQQDASDILESPLSPMTAASLQPVALFTKPSPSPSPPNLGRKTSLIDLKDWVVDDGSYPNQHNGFIDATKTPTQPAFRTQLHAASVNPKFNGTPLISLESPPKPKPKPKPVNISTNMKQIAPPQLPPRKSSYTSLKSVASSSSPALPSRRTDSLTVEHAYPPGGIDSRTTHVPSSSISSFHSVSLSSDTDPSTPGSVANYISSFPMDAESSINRRNGDTDSVSSLTESFEEVSSSSFASPTTVRLMNKDWQNPSVRRSNVPPKLPERPNSTRTSAWSTPPSSNPVSRTNSGSIPNSPINRPSMGSTYPTSMLPAPYVPRRSAPAPPSRSSDRSSIRSNATTQSVSSGSQVHLPPAVSSLNIKRPTPVPFAVRKRYEALFNANILQRRRAEKQKAAEKPALLFPAEAKGRRAAGWRGLSVDLITGDSIAAAEPSQTPPQVANDDSNVGDSETLEGAIVKAIWMRSSINRDRLSEIWSECDTTGQGALTVDAFVKGMWRIDEELRRAQAQAVKSATSNSGAYRVKVNNRPVPKLPSRPRDILR